MALAAKQIAIVSTEISELAKCKPDNRVIILVQQDKSVFASKQDKMSKLVVKISDTFKEL